MGTKLVTAPAAEPISASEAKAHLRVTHSNDDTLISALITAARLYCEAYTHRALVTQTWDWFLDAFPCGEIDVPYPLLQSITWVKYTDPDGVLQTLDAALYQVTLNAEPARLAPAYGQAWPVARTQIDAVNVRFVAGYGNAAAVPEIIKVAIKLYVEAQYYRDPRTMESLLAAVDNVLRPHRVALI